MITQSSNSDFWQVTNIEWNYNVTDDKIKVEIWEIFDLSTKKRKPVNELKLNEKKSRQPLQPDIGLDAQLIDVYKNTNGVILMFDLTKNWTFEYIEKEVANIPKNIPIIILGNHIDQSKFVCPIISAKMCVFRIWLLIFFCYSLIRSSWTSGQQR